MKKSFVIINMVLIPPRGFVIPVSHFKGPFLALSPKIAYLLVSIWFILVMTIYSTSKSFLEGNFTPKKGWICYILISLILAFVSFFALALAIPQVKYHFFEVLYQIRSLMFIVFSISSLIYSAATILFVESKRFALIFPLFVAIVILFSKFQYNVYNFFLISILLFFVWRLIEERYKIQQFDEALMDIVK